MRFFMYGYIYLTTNLINDKKYIGQHKSPIFEPEVYKGSGTLLWRAINKYGWDNFSCELLECCDSLEELNDREDYWIQYYDAVNSSEYYNISNGSPQSPKTEQVKQKLSDSWTADRKQQQSNKMKSYWTKENREKQSQRFKTELNPNRSPEARRKMSENNSSKRPEIRKRLSEAKKGKPLPHTDEWNKKIGDALRGRVNGPLSEETKQKLSERLSGKNNPMYGKSATKGTKWYTNGIINVRRKECPEGFVPGVTKFITEDFGE